MRGNSPPRPKLKLSTKPRPQAKVLECTSAMAAGHGLGLRGLATALPHARLAAGSGLPCTLARNTPDAAIARKRDGNRSPGGKPPLGESGGQPPQSRDRTCGAIKLPATHFLQS